MLRPRPYWVNFSFQFMVCEPEIVGMNWVSMSAWGHAGLGWGGVHRWGGLVLAVGSCAVGGGVLVLLRDVFKRCELPVYSLAVLMASARQRATGKATAMAMAGVWPGLRRLTGALLRLARSWRTRVVIIPSHLHPTRTCCGLVSFLPLPHAQTIARLPHFRPLFHAAAFDVKSWTDLAFGTV